MFATIAAFFSGLAQAVIAMFDEVSASEAPRETLLLRIGEQYDARILPIDLPGPDMLIDPILRRMAVTTAGELYDLIMARIADGALPEEAKATVARAVECGPDCNPDRCPPAK